MVLPSFAQCGGPDQSDCDPLWDGEVVVIGNPTPPPEPVPFDPPVSDPCEYECEGGGGGGGGSQEDPDYLACLDLYAIKKEDCLFRPAEISVYDWSQFGTDFSGLFSPYSLLFNGLPSGGYPDFGAPLQVYQNIIRDVARAYWSNQSLSAVNEAYWNAVDVFCIGFLEETFLGADRADCYDDAYSVSLRLIPSFSNNAFTISQVEAYGVTIQHLSSSNPFANWAAGFFTKINDVKECKLWFDAKDQIPGCI